MKDALMERLKIFLHREDNRTLVGIPAIRLSLIRQERFSSVITIPGRSSY
ncbi:hypothetical protein MNQ98_14260 [Paenibacillus sp. N3/727]|nr:hypothetical protein [Paenibacillus sp. N3/727]UNK21099.1 hypothetical protein MNQ98_14260 [Paenibacillus sp. N3/727]